MALVSNRDRVNLKHMDSIDAGGVADLLEHLRNRARLITCTQQFLRALGDGFQDDVAPMGSQRGE